METKRKTGRTTAQILEALAKAINSPSTPIRFVDHAQPTELPVSYTSSYVAKIARKLVDKLGLKDIDIDYCSRGVRIVSHLGSPYTRV